jgi:hypothetical protein
LQIKKAMERDEAMEGDRAGVSTTKIPHNHIGLWGIIITMNKIYEKFPPKEAGHIFLGDGTGDLCIHTTRSHNPRPQSIDFPPNINFLLD